MGYKFLGITSNDKESIITTHESEFEDFANHDAWRAVIDRLANFPGRAVDKEYLLELIEDLDSTDFSSRIIEYLKPNEAAFAQPMPKLPFSLSEMPWLALTNDDEKGEVVTAHQSERLAWRAVIDRFHLPADVLEDLGDVRPSIERVFAKSIVTGNFRRLRNFLGKCMYDLSDLIVVSRVSNL